MNFDYDLLIYLIISISAVALAALIILSLYYLVFWTISGKKCEKVPHSDKYTKFAILIAARNESKVIRNILTSLEKQTYPKEYFDVWAIVEDEKDPTCEICKEFGFNYFVRDELTEGRKTKGFALQECIRYFKNNNIQYDSFMIFDADNVMDPDYIENMNDLRQTGVKVGLGSRAFTNADTNWLTAGSAIMFAYMNHITSRGRSILFHKATLMGTGYFIDSSVVDEAGGWIFTGMTEDIQLTTYCYYHDINMRFYPVTRFYDEQSPKFKIVHMQHLRWVWGYFQKRKFLVKAGIKQDYHPKEVQGLMLFEFNVGLFPFVFYNLINFILLVICFTFGGIGYAHAFYHESYVLFGMAAYQFFMIYLLFIIPSVMTIYRHNDELRLSKKHIIISILTYIFYFYDFAAAFINGLLHPSKRTNWKKIEHTGEMTNKDAEKVS